MCAIQWGLQHEAVAWKVYENTLGVTLHGVGLHLYSTGALGSSPDDLMNTDRNVNIKCSYSAQDKDIMALADNPGFRLKRKLPGGNIVSLTLQTELGLKNYHQIQGYLYLTKQVYCD